jgi:initiation factor 1A
MVKNKKGGRSHKKMSSKHQKQPRKTFKLRIPSEEGEIIARVTRLYGHGHVNVMCNDGVERLCVIRKKFKGRNRRDNDIRLHAFILVGIRTFEVISQEKKPKCDLIYVYADNQKTQLKQGGNIHNCLLEGEEKEKNNGFNMSGQAEEPNIKDEQSWEETFADI